MISATALFFVCFFCQECWSQAGFYKLYFHQSILRRYKKALTIPIKPLNAYAHAYRNETLTVRKNCGRLPTKAKLDAFYRGKNSTFHPFQPHLHARNLWMDI